MTRSPVVPPEELTSIDQLVHNDDLAKYLSGNPTDPDKILKALNSAGIYPKDPKKVADCIIEISKKKGWSDLQMLELALGRTDDGKLHPLMG